MSRKKTNKANGRDYTYDLDYQASEEQKKKRASRNAARKKMEAKLGKKALEGKDVDHQDGNPLNNKPSNLKPVPRGKNRSKK